MAGFRKAKAEQAALKIGIYGPPGSGKTFTSLLLVDAERWRWMRCHWFAFGAMHDINRPPGSWLHSINMAGDVESIDAAIDAARSKP